MQAAYSRMFTRIGLEFRAVQADTGAIGGTVSEEFQVLAESGEDAIAVSDGDDYAANVELAPAPAPSGSRPAPATATRAAWPRPAHEDYRRRSAHCLKLPPERCVKTLLVEGSDGDVVALVLRGDHELNAVKAQKPAGGCRARCAWRARRASCAATGSEPGFIGPVGLTIARSRRPCGRCAWRTSSAAPTRRTRT